MGSNSNQDFCKRLYKEYAPTVRYIAAQKLLNKTLVEVVVEATFIEALRWEKELQTHPSPCEWLTNKALEVIKILNNSQIQPKEGTSDA